MIAELGKKMLPHLKAFFFKCPPLMKAAYWGEVDVCAALLREGADLDAVDPSGHNVLERTRMMLKYDIGKDEKDRKYERVLKVLEPAFAAKARAEMQVVVSGIEAEIEKGTDKPVAIGKTLRLKPGSFHRQYVPDQGMKP